MHLISVRSVVVQRVHILNTSGAYSHCIASRSVSRSLRYSNFTGIFNHEPNWWWCCIYADHRIWRHWVFFGFVFVFWSALFIIFFAFSFPRGERVVHWSRSQGTRNVWSRHRFRRWNSCFGGGKTHFQDTESWGITGVVMIKTRLSEVRKKQASTVEAVRIGRLKIFLLFWWILMSLLPIK